MNAGAIIVHGDGPLPAEIEEALLAARAAGVPVAFAEPPPPAPLELRVCNTTSNNLDHLSQLAQTLRKSRREITQPNRPFYACFQGRRRKNRRP